MLDKQKNICYNIRVINTVTKRSSVFACLKRAAGGCEAVGACAKVAFEW